jgi:hypothetical protein
MMIGMLCKRLRDSIENVIELLVSMKKIKDERYDVILDTFGMQ